MAKSTDVRRTPRKFFLELHREFEFDLDVCANKSNRRVPRYFGPGSPIAEDAFSVRWADHGVSMWMNPPYSEIPRWLKRAVNEAKEERIQRRIVCLLPTNTSAKWFHRYIWNAKRGSWHPWVREVRFHPKRLTFHPHTQNAMWPSMIVVL